MARPEWADWRMPSVQLEELGRSAEAGDQKEQDRQQHGEYPETLH
jgi:hypothetical protein